MRLVSVRAQRGIWSRRTLYPALPFLGVHAACGLVVLFPPTAGLLALAASGYVIRMWAVTAGYHRYFAHRAYKSASCGTFVSRRAIATEFTNSGRTSR
jgi:fatty-acid desaturase